MADASGIRHPVYYFCRALIAGMATHVFASHSFAILSDWLHGHGTMRPHDLSVLGASAALMFLFAMLLTHASEMHRPWPWLAIGGYLLLEWIAKVAEQMAEETGDAPFDWRLLFFGMACVAILGGFSYVALKLREWEPTVKGGKPEPVASADEEVVKARLPAGKRLVETEFVKASALVLFLSHLRPVPQRNLPPGAPRLVWDEDVFLEPELLAEKAAGLGMDFHDLRSLDMLKHCNWYVQIKAIQAHLAQYPFNQNLDVAVISSADEELGGPGSWRQVEAFRKLVERLAAPRRFHVQVTSAVEGQSGVAYENLEALSGVLFEAKRGLRAKGDPERLIVVDITGGKATCSAVGAALTLEHRERIQYVSTSDLSVKLYDLEYKTVHSPVHG